MQQSRISLGFMADPIVHAIRNPAMLVGLDGAVLALNDAMAKQLLVERTPATVFYFLHGAELENTARRLQTIAAGAGKTSPWAMVLTDRKDQPVAAIASPLPDDMGNVLGVLIQTEGAKAATGKQPVFDSAFVEDIQSRETRWAVAIASAEQGVWDHDLVRGTRFVSETWHRMRGVGPNDASEDLWMDAIHPDDRQHVLDQIDRHDSGETDLINYQYRTRHADGHWVWVLSRGRVVSRQPDGRPARVIGTDTDITELKTAELEHRRMNNRLSVALRAAKMGRWEFDLRTGKAYWDDRILEMLGITDGENHRDGGDWEKSIHPDDRDSVVSNADAALLRREDYAFDYRVLHPNGDVRHLRSLAQFVSDPVMGDRYVGINMDITKDVLQRDALEDARAQLEYESRHDPLTGLPNRRALDEMQDEIARASPHKEVAILHIDLDNFKQVNDTYGHAAGDAVLVTAARVIRRNLPSGALAARFGGDEFVILLADPLPLDQLRKIASQIIAEVSEPIDYKGQKCLISASIGIAVCPITGKDGSTALIDADVALYAAKTSGRRRYRVFDQALRDDAIDRKYVYDRMRSGFERGEIICHYQPQFCAQTLRLTGVEALARWQSPDRGLLTPDKFLETATEMGLIAQFDATVLHRAMADRQTWVDARLTPPRISVNVSADRLSDPKLETSLRALDLPPQSFAFELLESAFLDTFDAVQKNNLRALKTMGIDVEIDDFGTGHASIVGLLNVSPNRLKIDRELVDPITHSEKQRGLLATIVNIGKMQGVQVVAEGVETANHARILRNIGCDFLQGYALARPMPADALQDLLTKLTKTDGRLMMI